MSTNPIFMHDQFSLLGFDIRERYFRAPENYFLGKNFIITGDTSLCERYEHEIHWHYTHGESYPLELDPEWDSTFDKYQKMDEDGKKKYAIYIFEMLMTDIPLTTISVGNKEFPLYKWALEKNTRFPKNMEHENSGYDVLNTSNLSAVTNCGFTISDLEKFGKLGNHYLFQDLDAALDFRSYANTAIPEHAPFFIWRISQGS